MNHPAVLRSAPFPRPAAVEYPDSDGQPVAETDFQRKPLWYANDVLARRYRNRDDVYVSANLFVYYEQGNPSAVVAPDVFVVLGAPRRDRRSYKLWEEPKAPDFVLEITSRSTQGADGGSKRRVYSRLGVREYWRYDPTGDYLDPPLRGERLVGKRYVPLPLVTTREGSMVGRSEVLDLDVAVVGGSLRLRDPGTGRDLPASEDLEDQVTGLEERVAREARAREAAKTQVEREAKAREVAEARIAMLEARMRDLRESPPNRSGMNGRS